jgi:hypothetical protein
MKSPRTAGPPIDDDGGRDEAENDHYKSAADPHFAASARQAPNVGSAAELDESSYPSPATQRVAQTQQEESASARSKRAD